MSIRTGTVDGVATIEIARPEKKNALTVEMYQAMADAIHAATDDAASTRGRGPHPRRRRRHRRPPRAPLAAPRRLTPLLGFRAPGV